MAEKLDGVLIQPMVLAGPDDCRPGRRPAVRSAGRRRHGRHLRRSAGDRSLPHRTVDRLRHRRATRRDPKHQTSGWLPRAAARRTSTRSPRSCSVCRASPKKFPSMVELDLNPVMVLPGGPGCRIVDARVKVGQSRPATIRLEIDLRRRNRFARPGSYNPATARRALQSRRRRAPGPPRRRLL